MSFNLLGLSPIIEGVGKIADDLITSDEERMKLALEEKAMETDLIKGQLEINKVEAQHKSIFVAGWRPAIGWVGALALFYQFILYPRLTWVWAWKHIEGKAPPPLDASTLMTVVTGMLGIAGMRSFDKFKGTQTDSIKPKAPKA